MLPNVEFSKILVGRSGLAVGLALGLNVAAIEVVAQEAGTESATGTSEQLLLPAADQEAAAETDLLEPEDTSVPAGTDATIAPETPSFEQLDSAASDLNEALSGARAKLDELRQATELAAMAAELREELESSIQENNRLAASLAEVQSDHGRLETQHNAAQREVFELKQSFESSKIEIEEQQLRLEQREARIIEIEQAQAEAEVQISGLEGGLDKASNEISKLSGEISVLTGELETTRTALDEAKSETKEARAARDAADQELSTVRKQIAGMLRSVLLGGEPIDVSAIEEADAVAAENGDAAASSSLGLTVLYEAVRASNVRSGPSPDAERVGFAKRGDIVTVIGKVNGRNWFEVETIDGIRGFIFGDLIRPAA